MLMQGEMSCVFGEDRDKKCGRNTVKIAAGKETYDVYYTNEGRWDRLEEYRKEQLGY